MCVQDDRSIQYDFALYRIAVQVCIVFLSNTAGRKEIVFAVQVSGHHIQRARFGIVRFKVIAVLKNILYFFIFQ